MVLFPVNAPEGARFIRKSPGTMLPSGRSGHTLRPVLSGTAVHGFGTMVYVSSSCCPGENETGKATSARLIW